MGFAEAGISHINLARDAQHLKRWLDAGYHGDMTYMTRHGSKRSPSRRISTRYQTRDISTHELHATRHATCLDVLRDGQLGYISRYALGRDYHKLLRRRLQKLAAHIQSQVGPFGYRAFVDSAPVLEKPLARNAGLGWMGKHTILINRRAGSYFFLGELYTDLPLPADQPASAHCGSCTRCMVACPTQAIIAPYQLDARRCISYLTIELKGAIPEPFRRAIGNRIFGCDDCQLVCPWNKFAQITTEPDFAPRHQLDGTKLIELFTWSETEFLSRTEGMAIRRTGYLGWLRNIAVALGNAPRTHAVIHALNTRINDASPLVREHVAWALAQQEGTDTTMDS